MLKKAILTFVLLSSSFLSVFAGGNAESSASETPASDTPTEITVFLAASTTDVLNDLTAMYTERTGIAVNTNPASSGTLAKQLEQGAEADVYISASKKWMDYTDNLGIVLESSPFVRNRLVLIAPNDTPLKPFEITTETDFPSLFSGRISIGDPAHVPAGKYAQDALTYFGWYDKISDRIQPAADVRAALAVVELGETELGIVYETDAMKSGDKVAVLSHFPEESFTPIEYFCAQLTPEGEDFYQFLLSDDAAGIFESYGFTPTK